MTEKPEPFPTASAAGPRRPREHRRLRRALATMLGVGVAVAGLPAQALAAPDTTPPVITIEIAPSDGTGVWDGWYSQPQGFRVRASDDVDVARVSYRLTGAQTGEAESEGSQIDGTISAEGVTLITMKAIDSAGNVTTRTYGVGIDLTDPTIDFTSLGRVYEGEERRATFSCADPGGAIVSCTALHRGQPFASGDPIYTGNGFHSLVVRAVDRVGRTTTWNSSYNVVARRAIAKRPTVSGSPRAGGKLRITDGTVTPEVGNTSITSSWYVDDTLIAEGTELVLTSSHVGKNVRCAQTFKYVGYEEVTAPCAFADGGSTVKVLPAAWRLLQRPAVAGKARAGRTLRAVAPRLSAPAAAHRYQWLRDGRPIKSATRATYKTRKADRGKRISVRVVSTARDQQPLVSVSPARRLQR
ncbi:hypothetical protein GUY44_28615 [Pimelobacter simplex]|uniref:Alkaline phosphatase n=1 Tax=Nocardioides simplex TaxID=2045 RepID=A0A0A1DNT6_NOCSI|nr:hypothetical protein [Pimelobacter simplex]AIY18312.1 Alkaline phosphatase [Pimelobacter simplex]MCG8154466.1 hypothetical protein [Pimelobacter simplex]GEB16464.1 hypothetical protein NSI01_47790 [Pimelobacter simplex]